MIEVKGRKARPSTGATNVLNARSTRGVKIHMKKNANRGAETMRKAKRHGMGFLQFVVCSLTAGVAHPSMTSSSERSRTSCDHDVAPWVSRETGVGTACGVGCACGVYIGDAGAEL